jgi:hypothetical protein
LGRTQTKHKAKSKTENAKLRSQPPQQQRPCEGIRCRRTLSNNKPMSSRDDPKLSGGRQSRRCSTGPPRQEPTAISYGNMRNEQIQRQYTEERESNRE